MSYALTVNAGVHGLVSPAGIRYRPGDTFTVSDREFGMITVGAKALLTPGSDGATAGSSTGYVGGTLSHQVTVTAGLKNVVLPNGLRYSGGAVVVLSDEEYAMIFPASRAALFSADTTTLT